MLRRSFRLVLAALACVAPGCGPPAVLTSVESVAALPGPRAQRSEAVDLRGVVAYDDASSGSFYLLDARAGVFVHAPAGEVPRSGTEVQVRGVTAREEAYNAVLASQVTVLGPPGAPPPARRVDGMELAASRFEWVDVEGVVRATSIQNDETPGLDVVAGATRFTARIAEHSGADYRALVDARIRLRGLTQPTVDSRGRILRHRLLVSRLEDLVVLEHGPGDPFSIPLRPIAALGPLGRVDATGHRVRVQGAVVEHHHDGVLFLRDETGSVEVRTGPMPPFRAGARVEVAAFVSRRRGSLLLLEDALVRPVAPESALRAPGRRSARRLTTARQVHALSAEEAGEGLPVRLRGIVTYFDPTVPFAFVQDGTGGIYVNAEDDKSLRLDPGAVVEVDGETDPGYFAPSVYRARFRVLEQGELPPTPPLSLEDLLEGEQDSNWVAADGIVRSVSRDVQGRVLLGLASGEHSFRAVVQGFPGAELPTHLVDARVSVRGACGAVFNEKRQLLGLLLWVPSPEEVAVRVPAPEDPFSIRLRAVTSLMRFSPGEDSEHRVRVRGVVTLQKPGEALFIRDGTGGLRVDTTQGGRIEAGDHVDVVGFAARGDYTPLLQDAAFRVISGGPRPEPVPITAEEALSGNYDSQLVQIEAALLDRAVDGSRDVLTLQAGRHSFAALLEGAASREALGHVREGSLLRLTGICLVQTSPFKLAKAIRPRIESFRILLDGPGDVTVLQEAPWWTARRTLGALAAMTVAVASALVWVHLLRRKVGQQTALIARQLAAEEGLREAAQSASRAKGEFLATMSHEIRTPLNGVLGMMGLLLDTDLTREQKGYAETVRGSAEALLGIINDVLDISKIEAGRLAVEPLPFDLSQCVDDVTDLVLAQAGEKGLELVVRYAPGAPRQLVGDAGRIRQILVNLVGNAVKFTAAGYVMIDVDCDRVADGIAWMRLSVADTGIGIAPEKRTQIFEKFTQADASTTRRYGGTGLGLAICRQLVELMGGRIGVESVPGEGATFWILLPLGTASEDAAPVPTADLAGLRLLVADDNAAGRRVMGEYADSWGLRHEAVATGPEALEALRRARRSGDPFHVALVDQALPGMDGERLARVLGADPELRETAVVLLASLRSSESREVSGVVAARLAKPARQSQLLEAITSAWTRRGQERPSGGDAERQATRHGASSSRVFSARVLVVEDNAVNQRVAARILERLGCRVDVAADGAEAARMVDLLPYDLVCMDCEMPRMDGYEATRRIRERERASGAHVPIVAMTAHALPGDRERCLAAGMDAYVSKPIRRQDLVRVLRSLLPTVAPVVEGGGDLDGGALLARVDGDVGLVRELAELFAQEAPRWLADTHRAIALGSDADLVRAAHALKGSATSLAAERAAELAARLEKLGRACELGCAGGRGRAQELYVRLEAELAAVESALLDLTRLQPNG